jgi:hypothetical protein
MPAAGALSVREKIQRNGGPGVRWMFVRRSPVYQTGPDLASTCKMVSPVLKPGASSQRAWLGSARSDRGRNLTPGTFFWSVATAPGGQ